MSPRPDPNRRPKQCFREAKGFPFRVRHSFGILLAFLFKNARYGEARQAIVAQ